MYLISHSQSLAILRYHALMALQKPLMAVKHVVTDAVSKDIETNESGPY